MSEYEHAPIRRMTLREAVRKRPGMYFGDPGVPAVEQYAGELISNAIDGVSLRSSGFRAGTRTRHPL